MTLRLALLLVSLILIGFIGLLCHFKYRQLNPKKRLKNSSAGTQADALLREDTDTPYINENIVSDIPERTDSLLTPTDPEVLEDARTPELKTTLEALVDKKEIAESIAAELLPVYEPDQFIFRHVAILPDVNKPAAEIQDAHNAQPARLKNNIELKASLKKQKDFVPLAEIKGKKKITHLKSEYKLKQQGGFADENAIKEYESYIRSLSDKFGCEFLFALTRDEIISACEKLKLFIKDNDLIVILYILAKPEDSFSGTNLLKAVKKAGLTYGEFKFFHFMSETAEKSGKTHNQKLFSIANMYKPGSFDLDTLDKFSTNGLCAFMVPAQVSDPIAGFTEMSTRCKEIADDLSGVLTTNQRELLNEENYKHICHLIIQQKARLNDRGIENGSEIAHQMFG